MRMHLVTRLVPQPAMSVVLLAVWILAFNRFSPGIALTGTLLAGSIYLAGAKLTGAKAAA